MTKTAILAACAAVAMCATALAGGYRYQGWDGNGNYVWGNIDPD